VARAVSKGAEAIRWDLSDLYASPIFRARKGSAHGYDVVDTGALNPELGTEDDFNALHQELQRHRIGLLLDVVPNHMAASAENAWWMSVLENGEHSRFLHYFDIDLTEQTIKVSGNTAIVRHILSGNTNDGGKPGTVKLGVLTIWQKQKGQWRLLARQAFKLP